MAKRFRFRITRVFPSFHGCRSTDGDVAVIPRSPEIDRRRHPPVVDAAGCGCRRRSRRRRRRQPISSCSDADADADADDVPLARGAPGYLWRREEKWHVVTPGDGGCDSSPRRKIDSDAGRRRRRGRGAGSAWLSSEEEEEEEEEEEDDDETERLVSSPENLLRRRRRAAAEGRVGESFAVVKRSEDPRGDFRRSMAEMVVEKEIYDAAGLEQLLRCFLSLNDRRHHRAITAAFGDIWDAVFPSPVRLR